MCTNAGNTQNTLRSYSGQLNSIIGKCAFNNHVHIYFSTNQVQYRWQSWLELNAFRRFGFSYGFSHCFVTLIAFGCNNNNITAYDWLAFSWCTALQRARLSSVADPPRGGFTCE